MKQPLFEMFAFIGSAGYSVTEVLEYLPNGEVRVLAERPVSRLVYELTTTVRHLTVLIV